MTISQRGSVEGINGEQVLCDVVCTGRFYDFVVKENDEWKLLHRQPIYEKDRIDPVDSSAVVKLDKAKLATFPEGYRHLAYIQTHIGYTVKMDMPMLKGAVVEELYRRGARWLAGEDIFAAVELLSAIGTIGRRISALVWPISSQANFTGPGLVSQNIALCSGISRS